MLPKITDSSSDWSDIEKHLVSLLENAIGITITNENINDNKIFIKYDTDLSDIFWRIDKELGIKIDKNIFKNNNSINSIRSLIDFVKIYS